MSNKYPLFVSPVQAGFPSFANDQIESILSIDELLVTHPQATFFVRVSGDSMKNASILEGDILVVDRCLAPSNGKIVIAVVNNDLTVKYFFKNDQTIKLEPANDKYPPLTFDSGDELIIWGVVVGVIRKI